MEDTTRITETLASLAHAEDADSAYIIAATINLYSESLRRVGGRVLYGPDDAKALIGIINTFLSVKDIIHSYRPAVTRAEPTEDEKGTLLFGAERGRRL